MYTKTDKARDDGFNDFVSTCLVELKNRLEDETDNLDAETEEELEAYRKGVIDAYETIKEFLESIQY